MTTSILYLNPDGASDIEGPMENVEKAVREHPLTQEFTFEEFVKAFNFSEISDLGYITGKEAKE